MSYFCVFKRSLLGVKICLSHARRSPLGVKFKISDKHPRLFHMGVPPPRVFRLRAVSHFSLQSYCTRNLSMRAAIREAIALAEIRARPILSKKRQTASSLLFFHTMCKALCQQLPTLLDVTRCVRFHTLLHVVACCWELLR